MTKIATARRPLGPSGVAAVSLIGTTIEYYDFYVYTTTVVMVLGPLFFPADDALTSSLLAFSTLGIGFLARPLGGMIFAHYGDRFGRKNTLVTSLLMMGVATVLVGILPTYAQVGVWAPILLVTCRFVQGLAVGGEWGGAVLLAVEHAPAKKRAFYGAFPQFGSPLGLLVSSGVISLFMLMPSGAFESWGWRIPFLLSIVMLAVGLVMRLRIEESKDYVKAATERVADVKLPIAMVVRDHWRVVVVGTGITLISHSLYIITTFLPSYAKSTLGVSAGVATNSLVIASACGVVVLGIIAVKIDGRDRRRFALTSAVLLGLWAFPAFFLASAWGTAGMTIAVTVGYLSVLGHYAVLSSLLADLFPTNVRFTGISLCYQLSAILAGGILPLLTSYFVGAAGGSYWPAPTLLAATCVLTAVASMLARPVPTTGYQNLPTSRNATSAIPAEVKQ
ncbi:MAG: MFS transporter [Hyphomicrobiales bacterium]|nr:MAG: MFS transporter [Hyphomicrobiales bacterium]